MAACPSPRPRHACWLRPASTTWRAARRPRSPTRMGTSRRNVSRMLSEAQKQGIVEIRINDPAGRVHELEEELHAPVRPPRRAGRPRRHRRRPAARGPGRHPGRPAAARQPQGLDDRGAVLGPRAPVDGLRHHRRPGAPRAHPRPARRRALLDPQRDQRPGAGPRARRTPRRRLPLPARTGRARVQRVARRPARRAVHRRAAGPGGGRADLAFVGIGTPTPRLVGGRSSSRSTSATAEQQGASGPPARSATSPPATTTPTGQPIHGAVEDRVLAVTLDDLPRSPTSSASPHGRAKTPGVLGALRGPSSTPSSATRASRAPAQRRAAPRGRHPHHGRYLMPTDRL